MRRPTWYLTAETPRLDPLLATGETNNRNQQATNQQRKIQQNTLNMHRVSLYNVMSPIDILAFSDNIKAKHYGI
jgi:hypothetical protein